MVREVCGFHQSVQGKGRLKKMIRSGRSSAQAVTRARILLKTDEVWTASQVAVAFDVSDRTVRRAKRRYVEEGLEEVLRHHNSPIPHYKVGEKVELGLVESLSYETVRLHLKKTCSSRGGSSSRASPG